MTTGEAEYFLDTAAASARKATDLARYPSARAFQERLAAEHAASLVTLLPIKQGLAATDRLIDQAVYRL